MRQNFMPRVGLFVAAILGLLPAAVLAGDYSGDFSLRLAPAFVRFTEVSSIGGATVANRWSSAINPASADWNHLPGNGLVITPYYSLVMFDSTTRLHIIGESFTWDMGEWGTIQPTVSQIRSNHEPNNQGMEFGYSVDTAQVQWAKRFDKLALGIDVNVARAEVVQRGTVAGRQIYADGNAESYRLRLGGLYAPCDKWLLGLIVEYGAQPYRSLTVVTVPLPNPYPPMVINTRDTGTQQQFLARPGVSYEYAENSSVYADYELGIYQNKNGTLHDSRVSLGIDHQLFPFLFVRAGTGVDFLGNASWTAGLSMHFAKWGSFDLGYQYDPLPEIRPEFGRAQVIQATFIVRF